MSGSYCSDKEVVSPSFLWAWQLCGTCCLGVAQELCHTKQLSHVLVQFGPRPRIVAPRQDIRRRDGTVRRHSVACVEENTFLCGTSVAAQSTSVHGHGNFWMHVAQPCQRRWRGKATAVGSRALGCPVAFAPLQQTVQSSGMLIHHQRSSRGPMVVIAEKANS